MRSSMVGSHACVCQPVETASKNSHATANNPVEQIKRQLWFEGELNWVESLPESSPCGSILAPPLACRMTMSVNLRASDARSAPYQSYQSTRLISHPSN